MPIGTGIPTIGATSRAAFKVENTTYGLPMALGAANSIYVVSQSFVPSNAVLTLPEYRGGNFASKMRRAGVHRIAGTLVIEPHYNLTPLIFSVMGMSANGFSPIDLGSGAFRHYIEPSDMHKRRYTFWEKSTSTIIEISRRGTLGIDYGHSIGQINAVQFGSFSFASGPNNSRLTLLGQGQQILFDTADNSSSSTWTFDNGSRVLWHDLVVYAKPKDRITLGGSVTVTCFETDSNFDTVTIPAGSYSPARVIRMVEKQLNESSTLVGNYHGGTYDDTRRRYTFRCSTQFKFTGGTFLDELGFDNPSATVDYSQDSDTEARPDVAAWASTDRLAIGSLSLNYQGGLSRGSDKNSYPFVAEGRKRTSHDVDGSFVVERFNDTDIFEDAHHGAIYEFKIEYTGEAVGGGNDEKLVFHIPQAILNSDNAAINGPGIVRPTIGFNSVGPYYFFNPHDFSFSDYLWRELKASMGADIKALSAGVFDGKLYVGMQTVTEATLRFVKFLSTDTWVDTGWPDNTVDPIVFQKYGNNLYVGCQNGSIYQYDGSTWSLSTTLAGGNDVVDLELYADKLYALDSTGQLASYDGTTWSAITESYTGVQGHRIKRYGSNLMILVETDAVNSVVYSYDGTTFTASKTFSGGATAMSIEKYFDKIVVTRDTDISIYDGTTWTDLTATTANVKHLLNYRGNLFYMVGSTTNPVYHYDLAAQSDTVIVSSAGHSPQYKPIIYQDRIVQPVEQTGILAFVGLPDIMVEIVNGVATTPIDPEEDDSAPFLMLNYIFEA